MKSFIDMIEEDQDYLPAVLGMATGFMVEKNQVREANGSTINWPTNVNNVLLHNFSKFLSVFDRK